MVVGDGCVIFQKEECDTYTAILVCKERYALFDIPITLPYTVQQVYCGLVYMFNNERTG